VPAEELLGEVTVPMLEEEGEKFVTVPGVIVTP
jgi:hypothetical protein